jgi:peptidoglycan/LPS O-acetylase OafA/YrhL
MARENSGAMDRRDHLPGLDALRAFLALWVVLAHYPFRPIAGLEPGGEAAAVLRLVWNNLFSGPAAVIVFFVVSGFCIHYRYRRGAAFHVVPYLLRRNVRIWIPALVMMWLSGRAGMPLTLSDRTILWSLVAEEIYYFAYPILRILVARLGWTVVIGGAYGLTLMVILRDPAARNFPSYGVALNWLVGFPSWILGYYLAERLETDAAVVARAARTIWSWRAAAWMLSMLASILRFHSPIGYPWTLTLFGAFSFFWLRAEILNAQLRPPHPLLESAGRGSYSLYLIHRPAVAAYALLPLAAPALMSGWIMTMAWVFLAASVFYWAVERPSHKLARWIGRSASRRSVLAAAAP